MVQRVGAPGVHDHSLASTFLAHKEASYVSSHRPPPAAETALTQVVAESLAPVRGRQHGIAIREERVNDTFAPLDGGPELVAQLGRASCEAIP